MDDSFDLARHVARFVSLLMRQPDAVEQQKLELRTLVLMTKEATLRLSTREGQLMANGLAVPAVLAGVRDLADQLLVHRIDSIELTQGMAAGECLAVARIIAEAPSDDRQGLHDRLRALGTKSVVLQLATEETPVPGTAEHPVAEPEPLPGTPERIGFLLARANRDGDVHGVAAVFEEVAFAVEQATREGRTGTAVDLFVQVIAHENAARDADVRRQFVLTVRRLIKPAVLHPIARMLIGEATRVADAVAVLTRCGTDGADAVVDQYASATSATERDQFRAALDRLPALDISLAAMLDDTRPHVVRMAAELIAARRTPDGDHALADHIGDAETRVRRAIVRALAAYDTPFALSTIARAFDDPVIEVRLEAVAALASRKSGKVGDIIGRAMDTETETEVQVGMLGALGRIATPDAVARLAKVAESSSGLFGTKKGVAVRVAAVRALAEARTGGARTVLMALAEDTNREVRDAATRAIRR
jgi:hypothetical protein